MPLAYGPSFVRNGEEFEIQILMAAFDNEWEPQVTCNGKSLDELQNARVQNRIAIIRLKADDTQRSQELKGTIDLVNKAGISISREWQLEIPVIK